MDKKTYIAPAMEVTNVETVEMIAASIQIDRQERGNEMLTNDRRGWGDLWQ